MTVSFTHPHDPYQCSHEHWKRYHPDDIDMPAVGPLDEQDPFSSRLLAEYGLAGWDLTDDQIRNARHGYYGSVSYVDDLVGELLATLAETGLADNTVIVFSTDHGDMMGERGLWYKRNFFEGSSRIPLLVSWPGEFAPARVGANVSLVDLLPTFVELAGSRVEPVDEPDGFSLVPLCAGSDATHPGDTVLGESLGEAANAPIVMVKHGSLKYIWSGSDPAQLFDLADDPAELTNLAGHPHFAQAQAELDGIVHQRWDMADLAERVVASQRRRTFLRALYAGGRAPEWRQSPADQAAQRVLPEGVRYNDWAYDNGLE